jgi:hypothetical protein
VGVKTEISDTQEIAVAGPSSADSALVDVYPQRSVIKPANWTGKADRLSPGAVRFLRRSNIKSHASLSYFYSTTPTQLQATDRSRLDFTNSRAGCKGGATGDPTKPE